MKKTLVLALAALAVACAPNKTQDYPYQGVSFEKVKFEGGLLAGRVQTVRENTVPFAFRKCEETGRISNFTKAAGLDKTPFKGLRYDDSDVFKVMEGAAYSLASQYDAAQDHYLDSLIALVGAAQESDGYLYTIRTSGGLDVDKAAGPERWSNIYHSHELYNVGHMYEAAVAHFRATGKRSFLDIAIKNANLIYDTFYVPGRKIASGHEEIELALVKLYRATGDKRYLDLSRFLLDCRGDGGEKGLYMQDHQKVTQQREAVGHAVRAAYLYMAMTDIAAISGDEAYREAIDAIWNDVTEHKLYLTGGLGSYWKGERFGGPWYLPGDSAYCETCAAIANCMWNYRMFCLTGEAGYIDVLERALYNNVLHGLSDDGMEFFYPNVLECNPESFEDDAARIAHNPFALPKTKRSPWFRTSCCPSNLARFILSLPGYVYAVHGDDIYVNLFESGTGSFETGRGEKVSLCQTTSYPYSGTVQIEMQQAPRRKASLRIRIPGWAQGKPVPGGLYRYQNPETSAPAIQVNGSPVPAQCEKGYAVISRRWKDGDRVEIQFEMPVQTVTAHEQVAYCHGKIAVERGPFVYCATLPQGDKTDIRTLGIAPQDHFRTEETEGVITLIDEEHPVSLIPYYRHAQDSPCQMTVFLQQL